LAAADVAAGIDGVLGAPRDVTIMFGDIENFTPLTERLGDEAAAELFAEWWSCRRRRVAAHGGAA